LLVAEIFGCGIEELIAKGSNRQLDQSREVADLLHGLSDQHRAILLNVMKQLIDDFSINKIAN
jgi:hypothetical protein